MSEKIGGAKGTELDDEFCEMEKVCFNAWFNSLPGACLFKWCVTPKHSCWQRASTDKILITKLDIILGENVAFAQFPVVKNFSSL